ncbi:MAG: DUF4342 domain-containing protein [Rhodobacteraceae bacterium]|nr:DUF4342 domain-containing protein [Paracoccaceae bacterium]
MPEENPKDKRTWTEEIEVSADKLMDLIREWAAEASVRRIRVKEPDGDIAVDIPLTIGAAAGGAIVIAAPILALIGALIAFFAKVKVEIVREQPEEDGEKPET